MSKPISTAEGRQCTCCTLVLGAGDTYTPSDSGHHCWKKGVCTLRQQIEVDTTNRKFQVLKIELKAGIEIIIFVYHTWSLVKLNCVWLCVWQCTVMQVVHCATLWALLTLCISVNYSFPPLQQLCLVQTMDTILPVLWTVWHSVYFACISVWLHQKQTNKTIRWIQSCN